MKASPTSDGNIISILVSLPAEVEWVYQYQPEAGRPNPGTIKKRNQLDSIIKFLKNDK